MFLGYLRRNNIGPHSVQGIVHFLILHSPGSNYLAINFTDKFDHSWPLIVWSLILFSSVAVTDNIGSEKIKDSNVDNINNKLE